MNRFNLLKHDPIFSGFSRAASCDVKPAPAKIKVAPGAAKAYSEKAGFSHSSAMKALGFSLLVAASAHAATLAVCDEQSLRAALTQGGTITLHCSGIITLTNTLTITNDCVIDATGQSVTVSGGNQVRVFHIAPGVEVTLLNLRIANGRSSRGGAGIYNAGKLTIGTCRIVNNAVVGYGVETVGGGIYNVGDLVLTNSLVGTNTVAGVAGPPGAHGTSAVDMYDQFGRCRTVVPPTNGGPGMDGGPASGGGLFNSGTATIRTTTFVANRAHGGAGGDGGWGGRPGCTSGFTFAGAAGAGGKATGGAVANNASLTMSDSLLTGNEARAGAGGRGGSVNFGIGATSGGPGGEAEGGAIANSSSMTNWNMTVSGNLVRGGDGGIGGAWDYDRNPCSLVANGHAGNAYGGGVDVHSTLPAPSLHFSARNLTIWNNRAEAGSATNALVTMSTNCPTVPGSNGMAFGASVATITGYMTLWNSIVGNRDVTNNVYGMYNGSHNICSDASAPQTAENLNDTDPQLGPLADNGGPTLTHALRPGSVAIDAGRDDLCPATDQRGATRPQRSHCDIGAYEAAFAAVAFAASNYRVEFQWVPLERCRLQASSDLITWQSVETKISGADGRVFFEVPRAARHFFRITSP